MNIQNGSMFVLVIESKNIGRDHFSAESRNVKKFTLKTTTITEIFKKKNGRNLIATIS